MMSDKEKIPLFLHVGFHKTGTTAIQKFLLDNREFLLGKGYLYPITSENHQGHHVFAYAIADAIFPKTGEVPDKERLAQALKEEVDKTTPKAIIMSSENFKGSNDERMMAEAKEFFSGFDVKIITQVSEFISSIKRRVAY